jgi:hypothetical protein
VDGLAGGRAVACCEGATGAGCGLGVWPIGLAGQSSSRAVAVVAERLRHDHTASSGYRYGVSGAVREEQQQHWVDEWVSG